MSNFRRRLMMSFEKKYTPVKYLESTGTQYIDTGVVPYKNQKYDIKFSMVEINKNQVIFGSRSSGDYSNSKNQIYLNVNVANKVLLYLGTKNNNLFNSVIVNKEYSINNSINELENDFDDKATESLYLFAMNNQKNIIANASARLYYFKIYNNDTLVRDYIPVVDESSIPCLYDKVEDKFYYNEGSGEFLYK